MKNIIVLIFVLTGSSLVAQQASITGKVTRPDGEPLSYVSVGIAGTGLGASSSDTGIYLITDIAPGNYKVEFSLMGYKKQTAAITLKPGERYHLNIALKPDEHTIDQVVVTGTMREVSKLESPVPVEVFTPQFFRRNPAPSIFDALQNINGVRPQLNCNICNTGDIHINGLEGPYTMVLIDGMPIVSGLSTIYGLSGIPNSLVERVEIVKGPASSLYGSEAVGGLINIITKNPVNAPKFIADVSSTTWQELNADLGYSTKIGHKVNLLTGVNYFNYNNPTDHNKDGFTDITNQHRISVFNKLNFRRRDSRQASMAFRYLYEDRWGGEMNWSEQWRGTDSIYGESIYTNRLELIGSYQLPVEEKLNLQYSFNWHKQNSFYGNTPYMADQKIGFAQLVYDKTIGKAHSLLGGLALRYVNYDDNTPATASRDDMRINQPDKIWLPGIFIQDEISLHGKHKVLLGARYDHDSRHGAVFTPRIAYKWSPDDLNTFRLNAGSGFRVVNLFTEDHAALTGAREVVIGESLKPEKSWNINLNYVRRIPFNGGLLYLDATAFHTYFYNKIIADYDQHPNKIIYNNLQGHAVSQGVSLNTELSLDIPLKVLAGFTLMDVYNTGPDDKGRTVRQRQLLTEHFTGTWSVSYTFGGTGITLDYTGNLYGSMKLPLLGELDPRDPYSPTWSIQNLQIRKVFRNGVELYVAGKNLLNFTPPANSIARANDPFDQNVEFYDNGLPKPTENNPYALTFDPNYVYAPNQGIRAMLGFRYTIK